MVVQLVSNKKRILFLIHFFQNNLAYFQTKTCAAEQSQFEQLIYFKSTVDILSFFFILLILGAFNEYFNCMNQKYETIW